MQLCSGEICADYTPTERNIASAPNPHTTSSTTPLLRASHKKREFAWAGQLEGWAHFWALDLLNNAGDNESWFAYYKEFWFGGVVYPPVPIRGSPDYKWVKTFCSDSYRGSELDWMTFYWEVNNQGDEDERYSFADFRELYREACFGVCSPIISGTSSDDLVSWSWVSNYAALLFPQGKAEYLDNVGDRKGVNL